MEGDGVAGPDVVDRHAGGRRHVGPRPEDAADGDQRVFRRKAHVEGRQHDQGRQHVAQPHDPRAIDGRFRRHGGQIGGGAVLQGVIHHRGHLPAMTAQEEEVDQAVFQRRPALLDRLRGEDRIDAVDQRGQDAERRNSAPPPPKQQQQHNEPSPEAQPAGDHPMVQHRDGQQVGQRAGGQDHQAAGDIDALDLAAGPPQPRRR